MATVPQPFRFRLMATILVAIALYHAAGLIVPAFARIAYPATYPALRHILFIAIDATVAYLFLIRPRWLIWPSLILSAQVFYSHGTHAVQTWQENRQMQWVDLAVIAVALYGLSILYLDRGHSRLTEPGSPL